MTTSRGSEPPVERAGLSLQQFTFLSAAVLCFLFTLPAECNSAPPQSSEEAIPTDLHPDHRSSRWPSWSKIQDTLLLKQYNTRLVLLGTTLLGIGAGTVGTFMLLRRRSLIGDVVSHASLPGIAVAFLAVELIHPGAAPIRPRHRPPEPGPLPPATQPPHPPRPRRAPR